MEPETRASNPECWSIRVAGLGFWVVYRVQVQTLRFMEGYGSGFTAPNRSFFDSTGGLWMAQKLSGKMATMIVSTGTQNGGLFSRFQAWVAG